MVIKTEMAARQPNGNYHLADMAEPVKRALGLAKRDYTTVDVLTVTASRRLAAYGVSIRAPSGPRPFVLSYDVAVWPPALISKKPGYLARELDRFP
jgi:hypothetical protein